MAVGNLTFNQRSRFLSVQVEDHYGFKAKVYHCADCATQQEFYDK